MSALLETAIACSRKAGQIHKKYFGKKSANARQKAVSFDLITRADTEAEAAVVKLIRSRFPDHNVLAEEGTYENTASEYTWIIDPLDGTNNFACGIPIFCASVAVALRGKVIAGAIYDVTRNELFYAEKGKGAFLNGRRIRVSPAKGLKQAMMITGFYYGRGKEMVETLEAMKRFNYAHVLGIRRLGAAALDLAYVACGRATGFWEYLLSPWDFCAGKLLVEEAGGKVTGSMGEQIPIMEKHFIVASNRNIHSAMLKVINA